jgi:hypothetical protein
VVVERPLHADPGREAVHAVQVVARAARSDVELHAAAYRPQVDRELSPLGEPLDRVGMLGIDLDGSVRGLFQTMQGLGHVAVPQGLPGLQAQDLERVTLGGAVQALHVDGQQPSLVHAQAPARRWQDRTTR